MCARNTIDAGKGIQAIFANRFLCSVDNLYPKGAQFEATRAVGRCAESSHRVNVLRYPVDIHNVNPTSGSETILGRARVKVERRSFDPMQKDVCADFYALYKFVATSGATVEVKSVDADDDHNEIAFEYRAIASNEYLRLYIYLLICDNTDFTVYPLQLKISASVEDIEIDSSNGVDPHSSRGRDSYKFNITDLSVYSDFDCTELQLTETQYCSGAHSSSMDSQCNAEPDVPCNHRCSISHGAETKVSIVVGTAVLLVACVTLCVCCAIFNVRRSRKRAREAEVKRAASGTDAEVVQGGLPAEPPAMQARARMVSMIFEDDK